MTVTEIQYALRGDMTTKTGTRTLAGTPVAADAPVIIPGPGPPLDKLPTVPHTGLLLPHLAIINPANNPPPKIHHFHPAQVLRASQPVPYAWPQILTTSKSVTLRLSGMEPRLDVTRMKKEDSLPRQVPHSAVTGTVVEDAGPTFMTLVTSALDVEVRTTELKVALERRRNQPSLLIKLMLGSRFCGNVTYLLNTLISFTLCTNVSMPAYDQFILLPHLLIIKTHYCTSAPGSLPEINHKGILQRPLHWPMYTTRSQTTHWPFPVITSLMGLKTKQTW